MNDEFEVRMANFFEQGMCISDITAQGDKLWRTAKENGQLLTLVLNQNDLRHNCADKPPNEISIYDVAQTRRPLEVAEVVVFEYICGSIKRRRYLKHRNLPFLVQR